MLAPLHRHHVVSELADHPLHHHLESLAGEPSWALLDSAAPLGPDARWSVLAWQPLCSLRVRDDRATWGPARSAGVPLTHPPLDALQHLVDALASSEVQGDRLPPGPSDDALLGYLGYELRHRAEGVDCLAPGPGAAPDAAWELYQVRAVRDRLERRTWLVCTGWADDAEVAEHQAKELHRSALQTLSQPRSPALRRPTPAPHRPTLASLAAAGLTPRVPRAHYLQAVQAIRDHIASGRVFEVCLTQRFDLAGPVDVVALHHALRQASPAPYGAALHLPEVDVVSSSPERFLRITATGQIETRPIKGTRPRGATPEADAALAADLATHEKDRAELAMITDLARNDLGRVCAFGTVKVVSDGDVEAHPVTFQRVSTVRGQLRPDATLSAVLSATFPGGSMTGAPKNEAMRVISELEPHRRGVYSGALGRLGLDGSIDLSIVIRTVVATPDGAQLHVGGAVVSDSSPEEEYQEALDKAAGIARALGQLAEPS